MASSVHRPRQWLLKTARLQGRQERALADTKALRNQVTPIVMAPFADLVVYQGCKVPPRVQKAREGSLREVCWVDHGDGRVRHVHGWYQRVRANATTPSQHNASHSRRKDKHGMYLQLDGNILIRDGVCVGLLWVSVSSHRYPATRTDGKCYICLPLRTQKTAT